MVIMLVAFLVVCGVIAIGWPAYIELSEGWNIQGQRTGEQIAVYDKGFTRRRRQLKLYTWVCAVTTLLTGILLVWDAYAFFQESSKYHFVIDDDKQTNLFMTGVGLVLIFLTLVYGLVVLRTKTKALALLEAEGTNAQA